MRIHCAFMTAAIGCSLFLPSFAQAQSKPTATIAPAEKLPEGWEEIDQRLLFLMVRLANVEASLDAVEKAIGTDTRKKAAKTGEGKRAEAGNEKMDRKGGGPMKWSEFYGTTAEAFFYHPTDRNSTYHTTTVLNQKGPEADNKVGGGVPAGQGVPVHQRPPQFDYIYRANANAKQRAEEEAAALKGKIEALAERRHRLETEQSGLWCEVAFRAVSHYDLDKKPLYHFEPLLVSSDTDSRLRAESMKAAASFMALALSIVDEAPRDQAATFSKIKPAVSVARQRLSNDWLQLGVDATDRYTPEGKFAALAKRLDDVASNLSDSYVVANEGEQAHDQQRKDTFRAMLQQSLVSYAQIILALDEMSTVMKNDWKIKPDVKRPIQFVSLAATTPVPVNSDRAVVPTSPAVAMPEKTEPREASVFNGHAYKLVLEVLTWHQAKKRCEEMGGHLAIIESEPENSFVFNLAKKGMAPVGKWDGVWLGGTDEQKEGEWLAIDGSAMRFTNWCQQPPQPNNAGGDENYLWMWVDRDGVWTDQADTPKQAKSYFVCEWDKP
jgi:Lectin C-type domain